MKTFSHDSRRSVALSYSWSIPLVIWQVQLRSWRNLIRKDARMRIGLLASLLFAIAVGSWSALGLQAMLMDWRSLGATELNVRLWLLCLLVGTAMGLVVPISVRGMLRSDETVLLFTLPLSSAQRFRATLGSLFISHLSFWLLIQYISTAFGFFTALSWAGMLWFFLMQVIIAASVAIWFVLSLLFLRYVLIPGRSAIYISLLGLVGALMGYLVVVSHSAQFLLAGLHPALGLCMMGLLLAGLWGPGAFLCGRLYSAVFVQEQGNFRAQRTFRMPGMRLLLRFFSRHRGLFWALWMRAIINQSRNWLFWFRMVQPLVLLTLFPLVHGWLTTYGLADLTLCAAYAALIAVVQILETGPGALSGEGDRLALYLSMPFSHRQIVQARFAMFFFPVLAEALIIGLILSGSIALPFWQWLLALLIIVLLVFPCVVLLVGGSAWDIDLARSIESLEDRMLLEEGPFTPRKMVLFNLCLVLFAALLAVLWILPLILSIFLFVLFSIGIAIGMEHFSLSRIQQALKQG